MSGGTREVSIVTSTSRCPWCHDSINADSDRAARVACAGCLAIVHDECWRESGACPCCAWSDRLVPEQTLAGDRRLCLSCSEWVSADAEKVVCRGCVGVTHPECWPKGTACPGPNCGDRRRLVPEENSFWLPRYDALGATLWQRLREHPDYLEWANPEVAEDLLERACVGQRKIDGVSPLLGWLILASGAASLLLIKVNIVAALAAFFVSLFFVFGISEKFAYWRAKSVLADAPLEFIPAWIERPPRHEHRDWTVVLRLDPESDERPDGAEILEASRQIRRCELKVPEPLLDHIIPDRAVAVMAVKGVLLSFIPLGVLAHNSRRATRMGTDLAVEASQPEFTQEHDEALFDRPTEPETCHD